VWRSLVALSGAILVVAGAARQPAESPVRLSIEAQTGSVTSVLVPSEATLDCESGSSRGTGFLVKVEKSACALARHGAVTAVATAHAAVRACEEVYGGPQRATITGTIGARRVALTIDRADGCGIADWNRLLPLLGDPERRGVIPRSKPTSTTATTAPLAKYRVQSGDTLTEIAKRFHTSVGAIVATNQLPDADHLTAGQELVMPPPSAARIAVELVDQGADDVVRLTLVGAEPSELVTFVIALPDGETFTGSQHAASSQGVVTTTYQASLGTGTYAVTATGDHGTQADTAFHLDAPGCETPVSGSGCRP
jgi:LysM repeat protein